MLSRQVDGPARMVYAHQPIERPRHFILIGTTNSPVYLNDPTGARRFWPIAVTRFDVVWIEKNRDQLWAEACVREADGALIRLDEGWPDASSEQEKRREIDPWEHSLREVLLAVEPGSDGKRRIATDDLWNALNISATTHARRERIRLIDPAESGDSTGSLPVRLYSVGRCLRARLQIV